MTERSVEYVPLEDLVGDDRNPKAHDLSTIQSSIRRFGFVDPIVRDERTGRIIGGHGRLEALRSLQEQGEQAPSGVQKRSIGGWAVPVVVGWSSRNDSEAAAALVALNRSTEIGGWDNTALIAILDEVKDTADGLSGLGYSDKEWDDLTRQDTAPITGDAPILDISIAFGVVVDVDDEEQQVTLIQQLIDLGYSRVRAMM